VTIHPTAIVEPGARIGAGVRIGAYAVVGPDVTLEPGVEIGHHAILEGTVAIGAGARIGHGTVVGGLPQDLKYRPGTASGVRIGAGTVLREYVTVHRATRPGGWTEIGAGCLVMAMSHVAHDCRLGDGVIVINYAGITGHCDIGDHATVGGLTGLAPYTRVGAHAYIGGQSKVVADVPPFMLVDGMPATVRGVNVVGLRRAGMSPAHRRLLQEAHRLLYRSGLGPRRAVERIRAELPPEPPIRALLDFIAAARRGICGPPARTDGARAADGTVGAPEGAGGAADRDTGAVDGVAGAIDRAAISADGDRTAWTEHETIDGRPA
jgi:UDP-N-acetylglucosamine acyltransferase